MEVFTGDHGLPSDVVLFTDTHLSPITLPTSNHHKISTDNHHYLHPPPPQKLRPIRCNERSFSGCDDAPYAKPLIWPPEGGICITETDGGDFIAPRASSNLGFSSKECQIEAALSSSSDETTKLQESEAIKEPVNKRKRKRKRKRKSRRKLELFIKNMMNTVMEKQEEMHKQLIEILEKKENERITREEAWRKQEFERAKRDEEARKQEISCSIALISFIQNSLGQEIQIPNKNEENQKCEMGNDKIEESEGESNIKRWPKCEVQALITVRAALNQKLNGKGGSIWEEVAAGLSGIGYHRTPKKCKEKWENINKYYRRTMEKGKERGGGVKSSKVCTYFSELEMLYKSGFISANCHDEDEDEDEDGQSMKGLR